MTTASTQTPPQPDTSSSSKNPASNAALPLSPTSQPHTTPQIVRTALPHGRAAAMTPAQEVNGSHGSGRVNGDASLLRVLSAGRAEDEIAHQADGAGHSVAGAHRRHGSSIAGSRNGTQDAAPPTRPAKPLLQRSQSEYSPRPGPVEDAEPVDEAIPEWGARHGFEDHYQSEHIISQLANVSCCPDPSTRLPPSRLVEPAWPVAVTAPATAPRKCGHR